MLPNAIELRLRTLMQETDALFAKLAVHPPEMLTKKPAPDVWSPVEVLYHLYLTERASMLGVQQFIKSGKKTDIVNVWTDLRIYKLLLGNYLPLKVKAPKAVATMPEDLSITQVQADWKAFRQSFEAWLQTLSAEAFEQTVFRHPLAGNLSLARMIQFFSIHLARHTKQIEARLSR